MNEILGIILIILFIIYWFLPGNKDSRRRYLRQDERIAAMRRAGNRCESCGATENLQVHHIQPLSRGGTNHPSNLTILCRRCNLEER